MSQGSVEQSSMNLKKERAESPDSDLAENAGSAILDPRHVPAVPSQPHHGIKRKRCETEECGDAVEYDAHTTLDIPFHSTAVDYSSTIQLNILNRQQVTVEAIAYRECYISLAQKEARDTRSIRFPLVANRCSTGDGRNLPLLVKAMQPVLCERGAISIHASSENQAIFSITDDQDAYVAYNMLTAADHATVAGAVVKFRQWDPTDEFGFDVAEQRISVSIQNLPLQLWSSAAVEHILSPYCALEYVSNRTQHRVNLQSYRCISWAQHKIPIPTSMAVCIPITTPNKGQLLETQPYRRALVYQISLNLKHYIHGGVEGPAYTPVADVPWYEKGYTTNNAICYMPPDLVDTEFVQQLSNSIIATCTAADAQDLCAELHLLYPGTTVSAKAINETQQIVLLPAGKTGTLMQQKIFSTPVSRVPEFQPWSPAARSTEEILNVCARITVRRVPAHFCTDKLMHLFLGGYAYMEIPDSTARRIITCENYRCIVWCRDAASIPRNLLTKVVSPDIASAIVLHADPNVTLRTNKMQIDVQQTASSIHDLLSM